MELTRYVAIGQYLPRTSPVHRLDPRTKILLVTGLMIVLFFIRWFTGFGLFAAFLLGLFLLGEIPLGYALRGLRPVVFLLLLTIVLNTFFSGGGGQELFRLGPLIAGAGGLRTGLFVGLRLILLVAAT